MKIQAHPRRNRRAALLGIAAAALCAPVAGQAAETQALLVPAADDTRTTLDVIDVNGAACGRSPFTGPGDIAGPRCLFDDATLGFNFSAQQSTDIGSFEAYATVAGSSSGALTPERLISRNDLRLGTENRVIIAGLKAGFLDDRVKLTAEMGWSENLGTPLRSTLWPLIRTEAKDGTSNLLKLELKLIDTPKLRWSMTGEMADVSDNFFMGQAITLRRQVAFPGTRMALSSSLKWGRTRLTAALDNSRNSFGSFASGRFGVSVNGISLRLKSTSGSITPVAGSSLLAATSANRSVSLEFDLNTLSPSLAADNSLLASLVPKYLMLNWRTGESESVTASSIARYSRNGWEIYGSWESPIGETTLGYWRDQKVGATPELGTRRDETLQLSHMVRWNGWRVGVDGMMSSNSFDKGSGQTDRTNSLGGSIAYSRPNGPQLMVRMGRDESRGRSDNGNFRSSQDYSSITTSLDLTDYLRKRFDRQDLRLKLEYRKRIEVSNYNISDFDQPYELWSDRYQREGLLVSFGMKL